MYSYFKHPNKVCMTYFQHMSLSLGFSKKLFAGSLKSVVHSIIPAFYISSTSDLLRDIKDEMDKHACHKK